MKQTHRDFFEKIEMLLIDNGIEIDTEESKLFLAMYLQREKNGEFSNYFREENSEELDFHLDINLKQIIEMDVGHYCQILDKENYPNHPAFVELQGMNQEMLNTTFIDNYQIFKVDFIPNKVLLRFTNGIAETPISNEKTKYKLFYNAFYDKIVSEIAEKIKESKKI